MKKTTILIINMISINNETMNTQINYQKKSKSEIATFKNLKTKQQSKQKIRKFHNFTEDLD